MAAPIAGSLVPAQLGFLAIFNPSLGNTDETIDDQIVYYASSSSSKRRRARSHPTADISQEERNERLRQIGLAQGMTSFSRGFAGGSALDGIDTEKSRVVTRELEPGWWILASINLTKTPLPPRLPTKTGDQHEEQYEYSTKEMKPAALLLSDLLRAHSTFLLHHDSSLSALFVRTRRSKFVATLSRYWDLFLSTWRVTLHGNPIRDVFEGINLASCGELGIGVGEEERGSGEREVLEGLVGRIEGLVDLVVSKFGTEEEDADSKEVDRQKSQPWLGAGRDPTTEDGAIFLGTGALSRKSLKDLTHWMEDLYTWGERSYGVIESPTSLRRAKARKAARAVRGKPTTDAQTTDAQTTDAQTTDAQTTDAQTTDAQITDTPPIETGPNTEAHTTSEEQPPPPTSPLPPTPPVAATPEVAPTPTAQPLSKGQKLVQAEDGKLDKMVGYLKLGYGSYWTIPSIPGIPGDYLVKPPEPKAEKSPANPKEESKVIRLDIHHQPAPTQAAESGYYLIGLKGEIEEGQSEAEVSSASDDPDADYNSRTVLRTLNVELENEGGNQPEETIIRDFQHPASAMTQSQVMGSMLPGYNSHDLNKAEKLRVIVYVNRPFIFTFLFRLRTDSLALESLYRSLHYQLAPLKKPLVASTSYRPERPDAGSSASNIYDLVWDPSSLSIQSNIPDIPESHIESETTWSRTDAISTHLHLLNVYSATRSRGPDIERTQKTSRGWWIVWTRLVQRAGDEASQNLSTIHESNPASPDSEDGEHSEKGNERPTSTISKEIFLVRRASDHIRARGLLMETGGGGDGVGRLVQGIGVDTRRYVEELLTLL